MTLDAAITNNKRKYEHADCTSSPRKLKSTKVASSKISLKRKNEALGYTSSDRKEKRERVNSSSNLSSAIDRPKDQMELEDRIQLHAGERIHSLGTLFFAYYNRGVRSDGTLRNVKFKSVSAKIQIGMGSREEHAAHSNPISGTLDNYYETVANDALKEQKITPLTEKFLSRVLNPEVNNVVRTLDFTDPNCGIKKHLPTFASLIDNSILHCLLNGTHVLPTAVNLQVDCPLEKVIRPIVTDLFEKVFVGELTPRKALKYSKIAIEKFFGEQIENLKKANANEKVIAFTELELKGTQTQELKLLDKYLFGEFYVPGTKQVDLDKTLRLLQYQDWKKV